MTELHRLIEETVAAQVEDRVSEIIQENQKLHQKINKLNNTIKELETTNQNILKYNSDADVLLSIVETFKSKLYTIEDQSEKSNLVYSLLEDLFVADFYENTYECPTWLGAVTNFYSNRTAVINLLRILEIPVPEGIESFRLPQDWTEEEIDVVFKTMGKHIVCNNCIFEDNLRWWKPNALASVTQVCTSSMCMYSEMPWQFFLRNPLLKKEKYLKTIGQMAFDESYVDGWRYLFKIQDYQELNESEIKTIINNINPYVTIKMNQNKLVNNFLLNNIEHIHDNSLLDSIYDEYRDSYDFRYKHLILKLPVQYLEKWIRTICNPLEWVNTNKDKLTSEQKSTLLTIIMKEILN